MSAVARSPAGWHRCMQSDELHTSTWRSEDPSTCPGLPSAILQSASSRIFALHWPSRCAGLCSSSDYGRTAVTATSTADGRSCCGFSSGQVRRGPIAGCAISSGHYAELIPAAGEGPARCHSTSAVDRSICLIRHGPRCAAAAQSRWQPRCIKGWA